MTDTRDEEMLTDLFAATRADTPVPSGDFMLRMQQMALEAQPMARAVVVPEPSAGILKQILLSLGGWPAMAGLAAAAVTGIWIGAAPPDSLMAGLLGTGSLYEGSDAFVDPLSGFDLAFSEG